jgi:hypothetical protein
MNPGNIGDGVDGAPNGISVPRWSLSPTHLKGSRPWEVVVARKLARGRLVGFFAELPPRVAAMKACSSGHHWVRALIELGPYRAPGTAGIRSPSTIFRKLQRKRKPRRSGSAGNSSRKRRG